MRKINARSPYYITTADEPFLPTLYYALQKCSDSTIGYISEQNTDEIDLENDDRVRDASNEDYVVIGKNESGTSVGLITDAGEIGCVVPPDPVYYSLRKCNDSTTGYITAQETSAITLAEGDRVEGEDGAFYVVIGESETGASVGDVTSTGDINCPVPPPTATTEYISANCGDTKSAGEFAGSKIYTLNVGTNTGDITVNFSGGNVPNKFTLGWNGSTDSTDYVGLNAYDSNLLDAGVSAGDIDTSDPSNKSGSLVVNKTSSDPQTATLTVQSPLLNDNFTVGFTCPEGAPAAPICPDRALVFQVCNSNSVRDDNFEVYLNDNYIGFLDLEENAQVGSVFIATTDSGLSVAYPDFACPMGLMETYRFNPSFVRYGENVLELRNAQNNSSGNYGVIGIRNYEIVGGNLQNPCKVEDLTYSGTSGQSFNFTFNYTECCPGDI